MIETRSVPECPLCNSSGVPLYRELIDELYTVEGKWSVKKCLNKSCRSLWLDPTPIDTELGKLYLNYTTHSSSQKSNRRTQKSGDRLLDKMRESVLAEELGYPTNLPTYIRRLLNTLTKIHPGWRDEKLNQALYVPFIKNGKLLDVGCGAGQAMEILEEYGWKTVGTDFDAHAIANAKQKGLDVHLGELTDLAFKGESFDAILLSHVIEHVPRPDSLLQECHRLLKPDGYLIAITPNADSRGHQEFKEHWRGLEVPRHLHIFSTTSLEMIGRQAGFRSVASRTCMQGFSYIWDASLAHARTGRFEFKPKSRFERVLTKIKLFWFGYVFRVHPGREETSLLCCQK